MTTVSYALTLATQIGKQGKRQNCIRAHLTDTNRNSVILHTFLTTPIDGTD